MSLETLLEAAKVVEQRENAGKNFFACFSSYFGVKLVSHFVCVF